jgi:RimJ/RimL family protein N-acetyltransferase
VNFAPIWPVTLEGPHVVARSLTAADLPKTLEWRNHAQSRPWFRNSDVIDNATHCAWFQKYTEERLEYMFFFESRVGGVPVGQGGIYAIDVSAGRAEVGRFVSEPTVRGRGLFREGLLLILEFARVNLSLGEVCLEVLRTNDRAIGLYRSLGFLDSGCGKSMLQMRLRLDDRVSERILQAERSDNA